MSYGFKTPGCTIIGPYALCDSVKRMKGFGKKALIVTGKVITKIGTLDKLTKLLTEEEIEYAVFNDVVGEPTDLTIQAGVRAMEEEGCDFLIGIGGGSPLDSVKAIAAMHTLGGSIADYMGKEIDGDFCPMVLIPTTAGTGSEATKFTIITDSEKDIKMLLKGDSLLPDLAVLDPELTISSPPSITAATGMDALTHAIEAYTSRKRNDITDVFAISAIKRIFKYLPIAYKDGNNLDARREMAIAAYEAGICINNASVTIVHGMSRPIGALFHVPHGISNAMLLRECLAYVMDGAPDRFATIAKAIGAAAAGENDAHACEALLCELEELIRVIEIPTLEQYGIDREAFQLYKDKMATDAMASGSPSNTIKTITKEDVLTVYNRLY